MYIARLVIVNILNLIIDLLIDVNISCKCINIIYFINVCNIKIQSVYNVVRFIYMSNI